MSTETGRLIRDGEKGGGGGRGYGGGGGGGGKREIIHLSLYCHHQNDSCITMGSDESHFNVSVGSDGQSHKIVSTNHKLFEDEKESRSGIEPRSIPLTTARPNRLTHISGFSFRSLNHTPGRSLHLITSHLRTSKFFELSEPCSANAPRTHATHARTHARTHTSTHARTHTHTHTHTHTQTHTLHHLKHIKIQKFCI